MGWEKGTYLYLLQKQIIERQLYKLYSKILKKDDSMLDSSYNEPLLPESLGETHLVNYKKLEIEKIKKQLTVVIQNLKKTYFEKCPGCQQTISWLRTK